MRFAADRRRDRRMRDRAVVAVAESAADSRTALDDDRVAVMA